MLREPDHQAVKAWLADREEEARSAPAGVAQGSVGYGAGGAPWLDIQRSKRSPVPLELVNEYAAVAFALSQLNANGVARVPLRLYAVTGRGQRRLDPGRHRALTRKEQDHVRAMPHVRRAARPADTIEELTDHPLLDALENAGTTDASEYFDQNLLINYVVRCLDIVGAAYLYPRQPDPSWAPSEIWPLIAQYVLPVKGTDERVMSHYQFFGETYRPEEILRIRYLSMRDPYLSGYAPMHACFEQVGLGRFYTSVVESILQNGARPSMIVGPRDNQNKLGPDERKRLERDINSRFGQGRQGFIWVTDGSIDAKPLTFPPSDLGNLEISKDARQTAANCFDVPIALIEPGDANKAISQEATHQHQYYAISPRCKLIAAGMTRRLARPIDPRLFFAFDDPVQRDRVTEAKVFDLEAKWGATTANEYRAETGRDPVAWGDDDPRDKAMKAKAKAEAKAKGADQGDDPEHDDESSA